MNSFIKDPVKNYIVEEMGQKKTFKTNKSCTIILDFIYEKKI